MNAAGKGGGMEISMETKIPVPGNFYRHFKGNIYQIREIATHSETGEKMVVYQAMYPPFGTWVRPLAMFLDQVDRQKYPEAKQVYRFEQIQWREKTSTQQPEQKQTGDRQTQEQQTGDKLSPEQPASKATAGENSVPISDEQLKQILMNGQAEKLLTDRMPEEEIARRGFLILLDSQSFREKRQILSGLKPYLNEIYLSNIAVALDIVLEEGSREEHYDAILHCLETFEKYEGGRLRL